MSKPSAPDAIHHLNEHPLGGRSGRIRTVLEVRGEDAYFLYREVLWKDKTEWEPFANPSGKMKLGPVELLFLASLITQRTAERVKRRLQVGKAKNAARHFKKVKKTASA